MRFRDGFRLERAQSCPSRGTRLSADPDPSDVVPTPLMIRAPLNLTGAGASMDATAFEPPFGMRTEVAPLRCGPVLVVANSCGLGPIPPVDDLTCTMHRSFAARAPFGRVLWCAAAARRLELNTGEGLHLPVFTPDGQPVLRAIERAADGRGRPAGAARAVCVMRARVWAGLACTCVLVASLVQRSRAARRDAWTQRRKQVGAPCEVQWHNFPEWGAPSLLPPLSPPSSATPSLGSWRRASSGTRSRSAPSFAGSSSRYRLRSCGLVVSTFCEPDGD